MRRWAYEIHSTFILKDAPLDIKLSDAIVEDIENLLNVSVKLASVLISIESWSATENLVAINCFSLFLNPFFGTHYCTVSCQ